MMTFNEFKRMREGLWLADKNALPGLSQIDNSILLPNNRRKRRTARPIVPSAVLETLNPKIGLPPNSAVRRPADK
jgi:hypothetical protein